MSTDTNAPTTALDIEAIRERLKGYREMAAKATPGPWGNLATHAQGAFGVLENSSDERRAIFVCDNSWIPVHGFVNEDCVPNASFIAQSRTAVPDLCDVVDKLLMQLETTQYASDLHEKCSDGYFEAGKKLSEELKELRAKVGKMQPVVEAAVKWNREMNTDNAVDIGLAVYAYLEAQEKP